MMRFILQEQPLVSFKQQKQRDKQLPKKRKKTKVSAKYLAGLTGKKRTRRANLIRKVSSIYKSGGYIPMALLKRRTKA